MKAKTILGLIFWTSLGALLIVLVAFIIYNIASTHDHKKEQLVTTITSEIKLKMEEAYFEGQKDAIEGDVRIMKNEGGCWYWIKSPWDDGATPMYNLYQECDSVKTLN